MSKLNPFYAEYRMGDLEDARAEYKIRKADVISMLARHAAAQHRMLRTRLVTVDTAVISLLFISEAERGTLTVPDGDIRKAAVEIDAICSDQHAFASEYEEALAQVIDDCFHTALKRLDGEFAELARVADPAPTAPLGH